MAVHNKAKGLLDIYTVEDRWKWYCDISGSADSKLAPSELVSARHLFYVGFAEALNIIAAVSESNASDDEACVFFARIREEVSRYHLKHVPVVGGRQ